MSGLSFFKYPFGSVVRNKRRSLFAIAGIVIALSLISGSWIAVDSSGMGLLRSEMSKVQVDFVGYETNSPTHGVNESYVAERIEALESVDDVTGATAYAMGSGWFYQNSEGETLESDDPWSYNYSGSLMFLSQHTSEFFTAFHITGDLPEPGTVAISEYVASMLNISVGENLTCRYENWVGGWDGENYTYTIEYLNLSFEVSGIWTQDKSLWADMYYWNFVDHSDDDGWIDIRGTYNPIFFNLADIPLVDAPATDVYYYWGPNVYYYVWIDRDKVVDLADLDGTVARLEQMELQLDRKGLRYDFSVSSSELVSALESLIPRLQGIKPLFVAMSLPIVALGAYLSIVGVDLGVNERKREIAILKSRGASNRQVFSSLLLESLLLGTFAGVLGLLLGVAVSRFLLDAATVFSYQGQGQSAASDFLISMWTVIDSVLFGVGLMVLSSYRPYKKISKSDVKEALHYYSPNIVQVDYKPRTDIILLSLSVMSIISIWVGFDYAEDIEGVSWITRAVLRIVILIGIVIFPLMPFFLSLSVIRLLTRGTRRLYAKLTFIVKPWTKELHYLVDRNIVRNPRRASNLCLIIALSLAFGLFISVTMESTMRYNENMVKYEVGADVRTEANTYYYGGWGDDYKAPELEEVSSVAGVESFAYFESVRVSYGGGYYGYGSGIAFDTLAYKETVNPNKFYFVEGGRGCLDDLASLNGTVLIDSYTAESYGLSVGDDIPLTLDMTNYSAGWNPEYVSFWGYVVGVVKGLPGMQYGSIYMDLHSLDFVPAQNRSQPVNAYGVFVDVADGYEQSAVADDIDDVFLRAGLTPYTQTTDERMESLNDDPAYRALTDFLYMEYVLSVVIMTIGVGILIFVAVNDREKELASIMARGSSSGQIRKILMGESITLMVLGLSVGATVGLIAAYLFQTLYSGADSAVVPREVLFTWVSWMIVVASVGALLLASLVATSRAGKIKLAEVLRIRGG